VWNVVDSNVQIKFCPQGKHFRPLAFFVAKGTRKQEGFLASCTHCRNRSESYRLKRKGSSGFESDGSKETQDASEPDDKKQKTEASEE
jgi:hypothetical protein